MEGPPMADERDEFLTLFLRHQADLKAFIGSLLLDPHQRDDAFQEAALTLWKQFDSYDRARSFGAWARGIAANKVLQQRDQKARFPLAFPPETIQAVLDAYERTEAKASHLSDALRECVAQLPDPSRHLLSLRYEQDLSGEEIARQIGSTLD